MEPLKKNRERIYRMKSKHGADKDAIPILNTICTDSLRGALL